METLPPFHQDHGLIPLEKSQFFDYFNLYVVFIVLIGVFSFWNIVKHILPAHLAQNKKIAKLPIFD